MKRLWKVGGDVKRRDVKRFWKVSRDVKRLWKVGGDVKRLWKVGRDVKRRDVKRF